MQGPRASAPRLVGALILACVSGASTIFAAEPRVLVDGFELELVAREPEIVTPVGMAFDKQGRLLVVESHTHQRPEGYQGPAGDRIRMLSDSDADGTLDQWSTFAEGYRHAMNLAVRADGAVYLVTRGDVHVLRDTDGNGKADSDEKIIQLKTEVEYPHNGLSGIAVGEFDEEDDVLLLGLGENFGGEFELVGSDGKSMHGAGGAGTIFFASLDGAKLERYATGFWNPFSICIVPGEQQALPRIFTVDNDPDASPPCRLLDVWPMGDYGHRWEYGRAGVHPLQSWDGELPGTLPMVCGTGEGPTAIVPIAGRLWVTSWGDHRIERYRLIPSGLSFNAEREVVVQGDANFRPTGMVVAPDGSLYFADWVDRSYPVHGKGRIWRLKLPAAAANEQFDDLWPSEIKTEEGEPDMSDPFQRQGAVFLDIGEAFRRLFSFGKPLTDEIRLEQFRDEAAPAERLILLQRFRWNATEPFQQLLRTALKDSDANVRLYAVRWIADEKVTELRDDVAKLLDGEIPSERYYLAVLGAIDWLDGDKKPRHSGITDGLLARELRNERRSAALHTLALRLISPDHKDVTVERLDAFLKSDHAELRTEAIRTLAMRTDPMRFAKLLSIAEDETFSDSDRADALAGMNGAGEQYAEATRRISTLLAPNADNLRQRNARPAERGRRIFFHHAEARCGACHKHSGRGATVGPDLTRLAETTSREKIIESILQPSREIAPRYSPWALRTDDGKSHVGLRMPQGGDDGQETYAGADGKLFTLASETIEVRQPSDKSIMPDGLDRVLSETELSDLVAFLTGEDVSVVDDRRARFSGRDAGNVIGRSVDGRPIHCQTFGNSESEHVLLVIATIHGNEAAGTPLVEKFAEWLAKHPEDLTDRQVVIVPVANPDGLAASERFNRRQVDLNRNFPAANWGENDVKPHGDTPLSEPESRALMRVISQYYPSRVVSIHQPISCIDYDGPGKRLAAAMAATCKLPVKKLGGRPGSLGSFVGEVLQRPIITLELPKDAGMDGDVLWEEYGEALITALRFERIEE